jgi:hypothetical protein
VAVPKTRGGRIEESGVRRPLAKVYGIGFWRVGSVLMVEGSSTGVVAMTVTVTVQAAYFVECYRLVQNAVAVVVAMFLVGSTLCGMMQAKRAMLQEKYWWQVCDDAIKLETRYVKRKQATTRLGDGSPLVSLAYATLRKREIYASPYAVSVLVRLHTAMAGTDGLAVDMHDAICVWNMFPGAAAMVIG